jgi:hypothetical protein
VKPDRDPFDVAAVALIVVLAATATLVGVHTGWHPADADEIVYRDTLLFMRHGMGVYPAQRAALILKEHRPPTSVRAIRPPTLFLALRWFPPGSWRWLVGLVYLADLLLVWRLARFHGRAAGLVAVALGGLWVLGFAPYLFLHAEVWGLPLFLAGLLAMRRRRTWAAVGLFLAATCVRELYVVGLLGGLAVAALPALAVAPVPALAVAGLAAPAARPSTPRLLIRVRPWLAGLAAAAALFAVHSLLASQVLSSHGYNARFGNERRTLAFLLRLVAPISSGAGELFGLVVIVLGVVGAVRIARRDVAAVVGVAGGVALLAASVWATRVYWSACWALPLCAFAPAALALAGETPRPQVSSPAASR